MQHMKLCTFHRLLQLMILPWKNPKYVNKVVAPTLEPISSIGGFRTLPDYSFDTMPDDYVALVLIGGFGWNTPVAEKVMPIIKSAIEQEKVIGAICNAASFMAKCGIDRETTSKLCRSHP